MRTSYKFSFALIFLGYLGSLSAQQLAPLNPANAQPRNVYDNNYYYSSPYAAPYGYGPYYGYPFIETPAEAFPDSAEAEQLFNNLGK